MHQWQIISEDITDSPILDLIAWDKKFPLLVRLSFYNIVGISEPSIECFDYSSLPVRTFPALVLHQNQKKKEESDTIAAEKQYSYNCTI